MKYLIAPAVSQGNDGTDFNWTHPGELLSLGHICSKLDCGCVKAFIGQITRKGTTIAEVCDFDDMTVERLTDSLCLSYEMAFEVPADRIAMQLTADWIASEANKFNTGDYVRLGALRLEVIE